MTPTRLLGGALLIDVVVDVLLIAISLSQTSALLENRCIVAWRKGILDATYVFYKLHCNCNSVLHGGLRITPHVPLVYCDVYPRCHLFAASYLTFNFVQLERVIPFLQLLCSGRFPLMEESRVSVFL